MAVSPEQVYKLNMHDEISATMAELIYLRGKYLETGDISVFDERGGCFRFYKEAVQKGEVKPGSPYKEDFDKDMALIVNGTRDMWEKLYAEQYNDDHISSAQYYGDKEGKYAKYHDQNYQRGVGIAYTIGGVDFTKYMDRDTEIPENAKVGLKMMAADGKNYEDLMKELDLPVFDGSFSLEQYKKLLQHKMTMDYFKAGHRSIDWFGRHCAEAMFNQNMNDEDLQFIKEVVDGYKGGYASASKKINNKLIDTIVNNIAKDYAIRGKELPEANDDAYNQAIDSIYTQHVKVKGDFNYDGTVNLRQFLSDEKMFDGSLPEYAQSVQDMDGWSRNLAKWCRFVGLSDESVENYYNNIKDGNPLLKYGGGACVYLGAPFYSIYENGVKWVNGLRNKDEVENTPIRAINTKAPQYRKWENKDGSRVSEVQYRKLPDLSQDVIQKPTKSYAEEKQPVAESANTDRRQDKENVNRAKMMHIIAYMNKINGKGKQVDAEVVVDALCDKYGDQAYRLMLTAINEPYNYAKIAGDNSITTSRAAVNHLCSLTGKEELKMTNYARAAEWLPPLSELRKTTGTEPSGDASQPAETKDMDKLVESVGRVHERIAAVRAKLKEVHEDRFTLLNDNTRVAADHLLQLRFARSGENVSVRPQAITAEMLRQKLAETVRQ